MAKRRKKKPYIRKTLLNYTTTDTGYRQYKIQPSRVRDEEIKRLVKRANDRLYKLEKAGLQDVSREYREVEHYALTDPAGKGDIYHINPARATIRFTSDTRGMTGAEKAYLINTVRNFLNAKTSTISGTRAAVKSAYETFMSKPERGKIDMTQDQYLRAWKAYRDVVQKDKLDHKGYNVFMELIENTNLYQMTSDQMDEVLSYINKSESRSTAGIAADVISAVQEKHSNYNLISI